MESEGITKEQELLNRGPWKPEEDLLLTRYIETYGEGKWATVSKRSGLMRGGKSCRLRWKNYLRPNLKRGDMSEAEEDLIIRMHKLLGNRWSLIAGRLPGRTDNEVKNYWNTHLTKRDAKPEVPMSKRRKLIDHLADKESTESTCEDRSPDCKTNDESNNETERSTINGVTEDESKVAMSEVVSHSWMDDHMKCSSNNDMQSHWFPMDGKFFDEPYLTSLDSMYFLDSYYGVGVDNYSWTESFTYGLDDLYPISYS
ncbi:hypothetical protein C5167_023781 [Papaver somniferum]|uniref:Uncharacterized protein n=1 Tax=Papaver somniferum TaxID=3469 RepID=A0A4Y7JMQ5_PAPSO|nr:transcription factor MYB23-like [Papaver somniferum]RZC62017.1 hypothetical protein C5167_023781 [Papaver somniferum]